MYRTGEVGAHDLSFCPFLYCVLGGNTGGPNLMMQWIWAADFSSGWVASSVTSFTCRGERELGRINASIGQIVDFVRCRTS